MFSMNKGGNALVTKTAKLKLLYYNNFNLAVSTNQYKQCMYFLHTIAIARTIFVHIHCIALQLLEILEKIIQKKFQK